MECVAIVVPASICCYLFNHENQNRDFLYPFLCTVVATLCFCIIFNGH